MNLREEILKEHSKAQTQRIAQYIGADSEQFATLMYLFLNDEYRVTQRAAWAVNNCAEAYPWLLMPYVGAMLQNLERPHLHDSIKRNTVRVLQFIEIPDEHHGLAFEVCLGLLNTPREAVAIKVFSMTVLANLVQKYPELTEELRLSIEEQMPYQTASFRSRGKKLLARLGGQQ